MPCLTPSYNTPINKRFTTVATEGSSKKTTTTTTTATGTPSASKAKTVSSASKLPMNSSQKYGIHRNYPGTVKAPMKQTTPSRYGYSSSASKRTTTTTTTTKTTTPSRLEVINPIHNGIDYSSIMAKKTEFGYGGPGFIVEFNCEPKYLKNLTIKKGLWKLTQADYKPESDPLGLGPMQTLIRIDDNSSIASTNSNKATPNKYFTDLNKQHLFFNTVAKSNDIFLSNRHLTTSLSDDNLKNINRLSLNDHRKPNKRLHWADNLESIEERNNVNSPLSITNTPLKQDRLISTNITTPSSIDSKGHINFNTPLSNSKSTMRRSFSHGDIHCMILDYEEDDNRHVKLLNETFDKDNEISSTTSVRSTLSSTSSSTNSINSKDFTNVNESIFNKKIAEEFIKNFESNVPFYESIEEERSGGEADVDIVVNSKADYLKYCNIYDKIAIYANYCKKRLTTKSD
jgi:hypothetical protein